MTSAFFFGLVTQRSVGLPTLSLSLSKVPRSGFFLFFFAFFLLIADPAQRGHSIEQFLGEWQSPVPLDVVFDSPAVNWSYSSFTSDRHAVLGQASLVDQSAELDIIHFDRLSVDSTFGSTSWNPKRGKNWTKGFEKRDIAYASKWIKVSTYLPRNLFSLSGSPSDYFRSIRWLGGGVQFFTNRGMVYRSFSYKHLQKSLDKLGLKPTTAFACINQYLFRPKPAALDLIAEYTSVLALPSVFSVGIHVRTGDRSMKDHEYDKINTRESSHALLFHDDDAGRGNKNTDGAKENSQTALTVLSVRARTR